MIRSSGTYKIAVLKKDIQNWDDNEFVYIVKTDTLEEAQKQEKQLELSKTVINEIEKAIDNYCTTDEIYQILQKHKL